MSKKEIIKELKELGIEFDPGANGKTLSALLKQSKVGGAAGAKVDEDEDIDEDEGDEDEAPKHKKTEVIEGITVEDPEELVPVERPLVIKPPKGGWKNDEQAEYAKTLNGYAYKNPVKWQKKKPVLIKQLIEIGNDPSKIELFRGAKGKVSFKNRMIEK